MKKYLKLIVHSLSAPLGIYVSLFIFSIVFCALYIGVKNETAKNIALSFFSISSGILVTAFCIDLTSNIRKIKETYEIRKAILIRGNYILYHIIDLWSALVESAIEKYKNEDIFTEKFYTLVIEKVDMACCGQSKFISLTDLYEKKRLNILSLINNWIKTYGTYIDPILLSLLAKLELCHMLQYNAHEASIRHDNSWIQEFFSQQPLPHTPIRFSLSWNSIAEDFSLFKNFEKRLKILSQEFNSPNNRENISLYSLDNPFFKSFPPQIPSPQYNYDPFYNIAQKYDIDNLHQKIKRIEELISVFMKSQCVTVPKNRGQALVDAVLESSRKERQKTSTPHSPSENVSSCMPSSRSDPAPHVPSPITPPVQPGE